LPDHPENPAIRLLDGYFYVGEPLEHFRWMREHAPVYWDESSQLWGVALYEDVMKVSKTPELFCSRKSSRPDSPALPSMINMDDPQHKLRRALVNKLTPRRARRSQDRAICRLVDRWRLEPATSSDVAARCR
jgi:cytochrome P450 family 142 subfamily A polypeptide 1